MKSCSLSEKELFMREIEARKDSLTPEKYAYLIKEVNKLTGASTALASSVVVKPAEKATAKPEESKTARSVPVARNLLLPSLSNEAYNDFLLYGVIPGNMDRNSARELRKELLTAAVTGKLKGTVPKGHALESIMKDTTWLEQAKSTGVSYRKDIEFTGKFIKTMKRDGKVVPVFVNGKTLSNTLKVSTLEEAISIAKEYDKLLHTLHGTKTDPALNEAAFMSNLEKLMKVIDKETSSNFTPITFTMPGNKDVFYMEKDINGVTRRWYAMGIYNNDEHTIKLNIHVPAVEAINGTVPVLGVVLHEVTHSMTVRALEKDAENGGYVSKNLDEIRRLGMEKLKESTLPDNSKVRIEYALSDNKELVAEAVSSKLVSDFLKSVQVDNYTLLDKFKAVFSKMLSLVGITNVDNVNNAYAKTLELLTRLGADDSTAIVTSKEAEVITAPVENTNNKDPNRGANEGQRAAIDNIVKWYKTDNTSYLLTGSGGTGKTWVVGEIAKQLKLKEEDVVWVAPAHKAVNELRKSVGSKGFAKSEMRTVASVLSTMYNLMKRGFEKGQESDKPLGKLMVVDEASMLQTKDYNDLLEKARTEGIKILFMGDIKQLPAPGDIDDNGLDVMESAVFAEHLDEGVNLSTLSKVERQDESSAINIVTDKIGDMVLDYIAKRRANKNIPHKTAEMAEPEIRSMIEEIKKALKATDKIGAEMVSRDQAVTRFTGEAHDKGTIMIHYNRYANNNTVRLTNKVRGGSGRAVVGDVIAFWKETKLALVDSVDSKSELATVVNGYEGAKLGAFVFPEEDIAGQMTKAYDGSRATVLKVESIESYFGEGTEVGSLYVPKGGTALRGVAAIKDRKNKKALSVITARLEETDQVVQFIAPTELQAQNRDLLKYDQYTAQGRGTVVGNEPVTRLQFLVEDNMERAAYNEYTYNRDKEEYDLPKKVTGAAAALKDVADIGFGYVSNAHKVQGSTYSRVFVDLDNIVDALTAGDKAQPAETVLKMLYVAVSRAKDSLVLGYSGNSKLNSVELEDIPKLEFIGIQADDAPPISDDEADALIANMNC